MTTKLAISEIPIVSCTYSMMSKHYSYDSFYQLVSELPFFFLKDIVIDLGYYSTYYICQCVSVRACVCINKYMEF